MTLYRTCGTALLLLALSLVLISSSLNGGADAADARLGAYLGCFNLTKPEWIRRTADYTNVMNPRQLMSNLTCLTVESRQFTPQTIQGCRDHCTSRGASLAVVSMDWRCRCTSFLPENYAVWPDYVPNREECIPMPSRPNVETAAVYYLHANANSTGCRLANPFLSREQWQTDYKASNVAFRNCTRDGCLRITQLSSTSGTRLRTIDGNHLYGQWQIRALPTSRAGSVTTFRLRSNSIYPNSRAGNFSEIDIRAVNRQPGSVPSSLRFAASTNSRGTYREVLTPAVYQPLMGWSSSRTVTSACTVLSFNWQPNFVSWVLDGRVIRTINNGDRTSLGTFQSPNIASRVSISIGTDSGGEFDASGGAASSAFTNFRRILCDLPEPATLAELGPPWLTAVLYAGPAESA